MPAHRLDYERYYVERLQSLKGNYARTRDLSQQCLVLHFVANASGARREYLLGKSRGSRALSRGRQMFQYLTHIVFGHGYTHIGAATGRDRTSVAHACSTIEDLRDDPKQDRALFFAEQALLAMAREIFTTPKTD